MLGTKIQEQNAHHCHYYSFTYPVSITYASFVSCTSVRRTLFHRHQYYDTK